MVLVFQKSAFLYSWLPKVLFIFLLFLRSLLIPSTLISGQRNCGNTARKRSQNQTLSPSGTNPSLYLLPFSIFFFLCVLIFPVPWSSPLQLPAAIYRCTDNPQKWHIFLCYFMFFLPPWCIVPLCSSAVLCWELLLWVVWQCPLSPSGSSSIVLLTPLAFHGWNNRESGWHTGFVLKC